MTRYRPQRGSLIESLRLTVEIETFAGLVIQLQKQLDPIVFLPEEVEVTPYQNTPDRRIDWDQTHIVTVMGQAVGFTDGPLERMP
jgi:hypothetical protein